jgi:hypothetical protein
LVGWGAVADRSARGGSGVDGGNSFVVGGVVKGAAVDGDGCDGVVVGGDRRTPSRDGGYHASCLGAFA